MSTSPTLITLRWIGTGMRSPSHDNRVSPVIGDVLVEEAPRHIDVPAADTCQRTRIDRHASVGGDDSDVQNDTDPEQHARQVTTLERDPQHAEHDTGPEQHDVHRPARGDRRHLCAAAAANTTATARGAPNRGTMRPDQTGRHTNQHHDNQHAIPST